MFRLFAWFRVAMPLWLSLVALSAHAETLTIAWDASPDPAVVGYVVYVGNAPGGYTQQVDVGDTNTYSVTGVPGQQYCFAVSAYVHGPVEGDRSTEVCTTIAGSNNSPTLSNPGPQQHPVGAPLTVTLNAVDPEGAALTFGAVGLPAGLTLAPSTGAITGTPTSVGTSTVQASVSDGTSTVTATFTWTITASTPGAATLVAPMGPISTTTPVFEWQPVATATSYRLWIDDNTATNPRVEVDLIPSLAGCGGGSSNCRYSPSVPLAAGPASWSIRTSNATGVGPWSGALDFSIADGRSPTITITTPTAAATSSTNASTLALGGTATDDVGVVQVTWANDRGGAGTATGTNAWSVASVPLATGVNVITVTARDAENNLSRDTLTVTRTDGGAPTVVITLPTANASHITTEPTLALGGTATDEFGVREVRWTSSRGASGVANGTNSWGVPAIALQAGPNVITVTARDEAGNAGTATLAVELRDGAPPTVAIVSPTTGAAFSTTAANIALAGTASDAFGVTGVSWANSRGGAGTATGTTGWTVAAVPLQAGDNVITVTARDAAGLTSTRSLTVTRTDAQSPVVTIAAPSSNPTFSTTQSTIAVAGTATDDFGVTEVGWTNDRGGNGIATGTSSWSVAGIALQPGSNVITVTAKDATGRTGVDVITITRTDGDPPSIAIVSPTAGETHSTTAPTIALAGTASDAVGVTQVTWTTARGATGTAVGTTSWSVSEIALQPGANVITVTARDASGNTAVDTLTVTLADAVVPSVAITAPSNSPTHSTTGANVAVGGTASDLFGVTEVRWSSDRGPSGIATGLTAWSVAAVALSPGANVITVIAKDAAGNSGTDTITVTRTDGEAPTVTITAPTANSTHSASTRTVALGGSATDAFGVTQVSWSNDRGGNGTATGTTTWSVPTVSLQPGVNVITVTASDAAGNTARDTIAITVSDTVAPTVRITTPASTPTFATTTPTTAVSGASSDDFGVVSRVTWANDRGGNGTATGTTEWSVPAVALRPGTNVLTITAYDAAGNAGTATLSVVATDSTRPTINITTPQPKNRYPTSSTTVVVNGTATDDFGVASITWTNDKGGTGSATGTGSWTVPSAVLGRGVNVITVTATDQAGNTATDTVRVFADSRKPTVNVTGPTSGATLAVNSTTLDLSGLATDDEAVTEVSWSNSRGGRGVAAGTTSWRVSGVPLASGSNEITITARDEVGNTERAVLNVIVDTRAPAVVIDGPTSSPTFATNVGTLSLRGSANDDLGVTQVTWTSDRGGSGVATGATSWSVAGVPLQPGMNVVTVTARDSAGNVATDTLAVRYDTRAPVVAIVNPTALATYAATGTTLTLGGTATDDGTVAEVRWSSSRGPSGTATGTSSWSAGAGLQLGANEITVTARDEAGNVGTTRLVVTATDRLSPTVRIVGPSLEDAVSTSATVINVEGSAGDDFGVSRVAWANDRGGSGIARGTASWIAGGVALQPGVNVIAVTAVDGAGNSATDVIRVTLDGSAPRIAVVSPAASGLTTSSPTVSVSGTASDDAGVAQVTFASNRGPSGVALGTTAWATPPIRLEPGQNVITVTARDTSGNTSTAVFRVLYGEDAAPVVENPGARRAAATESTPAPAPPTTNQSAPTEPSGASGSAVASAKPPMVPPAAPRTESAPPPSKPATPPAPTPMPYYPTLPMALSGGTPSTVAASGPPSAPVARSRSLDARMPESAASEPSEVQGPDPEPKPPAVTISAPAAGGTYTTEAATVTLAGTARHTRGITMVTWSTSHGASGTAAGRDRWSVPDFPVPVGTTVVTITARNAVGDLASDSVTIVRKARASLGLTVNGPTADSAWTTGASTVAVRGAASDNVVRVTWSADWGGRGTASGTQTWSIPTIGLQIGANVITVTAHDSAGNTEQKALTIHYRPQLAVRSTKLP